MRGYPQFSFWISITLVQICFSRTFSKPRKKTFELEGTILDKIFFIPLKLSTAAFFSSSCFFNSSSFCYRINRQGKHYYNVAITVLLRKHFLSAKTAVSLPIFNPIFHPLIPKLPPLLSERTLWSSGERT